LNTAPVERLRRLPLWQPLAVRDFRLLWFGQSISLFGDQFYLIALYWLALKLSGGSGAMLGQVLMIAGGSQAIFQLIGGAVGDRFSPRALMIGSDLLRGAITFTIMSIIYLNVAALWHLYLLAALFGAVEAFFYPAYMSAVPMLIVNEHLPAGNALLRGTSQLMGFVGRPVAGIVVSSIGMVTAFGIDGFTFMFAALMVWLMRLQRRILPADAGDEEEKQKAAPRDGLLKSIGEGLRYAWQNKLIRSLLLFVAAIEFSFAGPSSVGLAVMAETRFGESGASALGWMLGTFGAGMFVGILLVGSIHIKRRRGRLIIILSFMIGIGLALLGFATHVFWASLVLALIGMGGGMANIVIISWMQSSAESHILSRVMSLMVLGVSVLEPLSFWIAGKVADIDLTWVFMGGGSIMLIASMLALAGSLRTAD